MHTNREKPRTGEPGPSDLLDEISSGLSKPQKQLPSKLFYDKRGSVLFDEICELEEYYLTRTEISIMTDNIEAICSEIGENCLLIELGSGSSVKIRLLLDNLGNTAAYVPVDISEEHLLHSVESLAQDYPGLRIIPVSADYTKDFSFPEFRFGYSNKVIYYPGSTIGNFSPSYAASFLKNIAAMAGGGSGLLIGVDLKKDSHVLNRAYNDHKGVTAEFNLNMLKRLNRELGTDFDMSLWKHHAFYNEHEGRIEMHLRSLDDQRVRLNGSSIAIRKGETILTEFSYKYTIEEFSALLSDCFRLKTVWTDDDNNFSLQYLVAK